MSMLSVATLALTCAALSALAAPTHDGNAIAMALSEVVNNTVCPIKIKIDEEEHRIPRRIKMLKCARTPNPICHKQGMKHACCRHRHESFHTQCVEVTDNVLVRYTNRGDDDKLHSITVSVGCSCMILGESMAKEDR